MSTNHHTAEAAGELFDRIKEFLGIPQADLSYLTALSRDSLDKLISELEDYERRQAEGQKPVWRVMAAACKFVPNFIIQKLAQDYLNPFIIAQVTPYMEPKDSANIGRGLRPEFMGQATAHVDPELTANIAYHLGMPHIYNIFQEMLRLEYFIRLGEVTDFLHDRDLEAVVRKISDAQSLAKIAGHMHNEAKLELVAKVASPAVRADLHRILTAAGSANAKYFG